MLGKSTHLQIVPQQSTQNTTESRLQTYEENQKTFLMTPTGRGGVDFCSCNNFANLGSFAKAFVPIIPWTTLALSGVVTPQLINLLNIMFAEMGDELISHFKDPLVLHHPGGHFLPNQPDQRKIYVEFLQEKLAKKKVDS